MLSSHQTPLAAGTPGLAREPEALHMLVLKLTSLSFPSSPFYYFSSQAYFPGSLSISPLPVSPFFLLSLQSPLSQCA